MKPALAAAKLCAALAVVAALSLGVAESGAEHGASSGRPRPASLCRPAESIAYTCRFGRKMGSVCTGAGAAHYRFGRPGHPEIEIASTAAWDNVHVGMVTGQQGGHQHHVRFTSGPHHYIVFEGVDGLLADRPGHKYSGLAVVEGGDGQRELATLACRIGATIALPLGNTVIAQAPEALRDGLAEQPGGPFDAWF